MASTITATQGPSPADDYGLAAVAEHNAGTEQFPPYNDSKGLGIYVSSSSYHEECNIRLTFARTMATTLCTRTTVTSRTHQRQVRVMACVPGVAGRPGERTHHSVHQSPESPSRPSARPGRARPIFARRAAQPAIRTATTVTRCRASLLGWFFLERGHTRRSTLMMVP